MDVESSMPVAAPVEAGSRDGGGGVSNSGEEDKGLVLFEDGEKNYGGNRWPKQETLALLKIRSDMDGVFRDATHKAPLWDEVSSKLGELGFIRTPKKCKEKFENVYKYHKRTKESRSGKPNKNSKKGYRFSDELQAFDNLCRNNISFQSQHDHHPPPPPKTITSTVLLTNSTPNNNSFPLNFPNMFSSSTSSSTASEDNPFRRRRNKKRKWSDFFVTLTKKVIEKQEGLQVKFLEALERIENQRKLREEEWRMKEMKIVNQEHEDLVQEMSTAAAKDATLVTFLQKVAPPSRLVQNNESNRKVTTAAGSASKWPKAEIEALIRLRTELEMKYQENGAKGMLWDEISGAMRGLGYNRSPKRCKEKWENINKYFKKVKYSNKKRAEDSKTCPYFHQLDALYKEKGKTMSNSFDINSQMEPLMVEPEQQWPPLPFQPNQMMGNLQRTNVEEDQGSSSTDVED